MLDDSEEEKLNEVATDLAVQSTEGTLRRNCVSAGCGGEAFLCFTSWSFLLTLACTVGWFVAPNYCNEISIFGIDSPGVRAVKGC